MKRLTLITACILLAAAMTVSSVFAGGFQLNEHGARAMAMGGAFAARAYDPSAIFFNPAGLGFQKGGQVYLGTTVIMPAVTFYGPSNMSLNSEIDMVSQIFTPINIYGTYEVMDGLVVGLGINNPYGLGTEWEDDWIGKYITTKVDMMSFFFTPTVGYKITEDLSVGVGMNFVYGSVTLNRAVSIPFNSPPPYVSVELTGTGMGYNLGILYKLTSDISLGVSYRSSIKLDATGTASFSPNYAALSLPEGDAAASLELPSTAFFGVAYKVMENLEVEADYQFVGWSSYKELALEFKKNNSKSVSPKHYEDTYILRVGAEYTWDEFQFRGGWLYDNSPVLDEYMEPMLPDASRNGFNIGAGYQINESMRVDVSYMFIKFDQRKVVNTHVAFDGTYNASANLLGLNFGYTF